jgi:hypothetical protein|nr:hypothetical protein [uncultured Acidovorax sp.]
MLILLIAVLAAVLVAALAHVAAGLWRAMAGLPRSNRDWVFY